MIFARFALALLGTVAIPASIAAQVFGAPEGACALALGAGIVAIIAA